MDTVFHVRRQRNRKTRCGGNEKRRREGLTKRIKDKDAGRSVDGVIQKVKYIMKEGRGRNEVLHGRGVQNTVIGLGVSQEIDRKSAQYPQGK